MTVVYRILRWSHQVSNHQCVHLLPVHSCTNSDTDGAGNGKPLQYSCLENPVDGGAWWATLHGVATSRTRLSDFTFTFHFHTMEKEMATHSGVLAWRIPGTGEPGGLLSMGLHRGRHNWIDLAAAAYTYIYMLMRILETTDIRLGYVYCISSLSNLNVLIKEIKRKTYIYIYIYTPIFWPTYVKSRLTGKDPDAGNDWGQKEKEVAEDEISRKPHQINVQECAQTLGDNAAQETLACCSLWGR